jgi:hypothetical protein
MTYDRIDWHTKGNFPKNLPFKNGGTHIGMFIAWVINNNLISEFHIEKSKESIEKVKRQQMTGTEFLIKECDAKFWEEDLNEIGNRFSQFYYANNNDYGEYIDDYSITFSNYDTLYNIEDTWENFKKIESVITKKYNDWKNQLT